MTVSVNDVLDYLVSQSSVPSNFGAQLERMRFGTHATPDPFRARDQVEEHLIEQAQIIRCIDAFAARQKLPMQKPAIIEKVCKESRLPQGYVALAVLRAYHERSTQSKERGLVEVYIALKRIAPVVTPPRPAIENVDLLQLFREDRAKRCKFFACEAYADALLGIQQHVRIHAKNSVGD